MKLILRHNLPGAPPFSSLARRRTRSFSALARSFASRSRTFCSSFCRRSRSFVERELVDDSSPVLTLPLLEAGTQEGVEAGGPSAGRVMPEGADGNRCLGSVAVPAGDASLALGEGVERPSPYPFEAGKEPCEEGGRFFSDRDRERKLRVRAANAFVDPADEGAPEELSPGESGAALVSIDDIGGSAAPKELRESRRRPEKNGDEAVVGAIELTDAEPSSLGA